MKSPHTAGNGPYLEVYPFRDIPAEEQLLIMGDYKFLGWINTWGGINPPEYTHCMDEGHNYYGAFPNAWKSVQHTPSGSDVTQSCKKCKIYWKVDMS